MTLGDKAVLGRAVQLVTKYRTVAAVALAAVSILAVGVIFLRLRAERGIGADFNVYWSAARVFLGMEPGDLYPGGMPGTVSEAHPDGLAFTYPPFAAALFAPMAFLPFKIALALHTASIFAGAAVLAFWFVRRFGPKLPRLEQTALTAAGAAAMLLTVPWMETLKFGQINHVLMIMIIGDVYLLHRGRGMFVGIAAGIKLTPIVLLVFFVARRDWKGAATAIASFAATVGIMFLLSPADALTYWGGALSDTSRVGDVANVSNASVNGLIARLGVEGSTATVAWLAASAAVGFMALLAIQRRRASGEVALSLSFAALAMLLVSPISWTHHWVWVALVVAALAVSATRTRHPEWPLALAGVTALFFYAPLLAVIPGSSAWLPGITADTRVLVALAILTWGAFANLPIPSRGNRRSGIAARS